MITRKLSANERGDHRSQRAVGRPGSATIIMSVLPDLLGVPAEAVTIVAGLGLLVGMFVCLSNCFGDIVATSIVAKSENTAGSESPLRAGI